MKRIIILFSAVMLSSAIYGQTESEIETKAKANTTAIAAPGHECYWMKESGLLHCMGPKMEAQHESVKLSNGTTITSKGLVTMPDGTTRTLASGECITMQGEVGDCDKMHASLKGDEHMH